MTVLDPDRRIARIGVERRPVEPRRDRPVAGLAGAVGANDGARNRTATAKKRHHYSRQRQLFGGDRVPRGVEGGHDLAGETADVLARAAEIDQHIFDAAGAQIFELSGDLIRGAEDRGLVADPAHLTLILTGEAVAVVAIWAARQIVD